LPLSLEQESFFGPDPVTSPNLGHAWRLQGPLDLAALQNAMSSLLERHEGLRFRLVGDHEPAQLIAPPGHIALEPVAARLDELREQLCETHQVPLDLYSEGPLRVRLYRLAADDHVLSMALHPATLDAWGSGIMTRELWALYEGLHSGKGADLPDLPLTFSDHVRRQHESGPRLTGKQRDTYLAPLEEMSRSTLPRRPSEGPASLWNGPAFVLEPPEAQKLLEAAKNIQVTIPAIFLAGFQLALGMFAGVSAGSLSCIYAGRDAGGTGGIAAAFARRVPLGFQINTSLSLAEFIWETMRAWSVAVGNSGPPYSAARLMQEAGGRIGALEPVFNLRAGGSAPRPRAGQPGTRPSRTGLPENQPSLRVVQMQGLPPRPVPMWSQFGSAALFALVMLGARPTVVAVVDPVQVPEPVVRAIFGSYENVIRAVAKGDHFMTISQLGASSANAL
jgi:Condensation domain